MRGADLVIRTLAAAGVERIFSLSGNQIMPIYDACIELGISIVHTRHEAAAVFMADAWAQLTGQVGVALVTAAPGAGNAVGPLYSARASESPVLLLTGDSSVAEDGAGAFQELSQVPMTAPLTKLSFRATRPETLGTELARAIRTAVSGRPGPVHVALPFDVVDAESGDLTPPPPESMAAERHRADPETVTAIIDALRPAERPIVLTGPVMNATRAGALLERLADAISAPVTAMQSPRGLKDPALGAFAGALSRADLIVSLGKPVDFTLGFGRSGIVSPDCRWIVVDAEQAERDRAHRNLGKRLSMAVAAEPRAVAQALVEAATPSGDRADWREEVASHIARRAEGAVGSGRIGPAQLCAAVQRQVESCAQSVVICDGGEFGQWAQAGVRGTENIMNGPSGAIGGSPCFALAAKLARPEATVFALMGDGTIGFHLSEFETAAREGTPFVAIVGNDRRWNAEHQIQLRNYGPDRLIGCQLSEARYDLAVAALGGHGEYVTDAAQLEPALARAVASGKPACIDVAIEGLPAPAGAGH